MAPEPGDLTSYFDEMGRQFAEKCTNCGICLEECAVFPLTRFADIGPQAMMEKVNCLLKEGKISDEAYEMVYCCAQGCAHMCASVCPEELSPRSAFSSAIVKMANAGKPAPEPFYQFVPAHRYNVMNVLPAIQIKPSEARWFSKVPADPKPVDVVFFAGCGASGMTHIVLEVMDILDQMGISYAALAGGKLCCGAGHMLVGDTKASQQAGLELVAAISAFRPKQAVFYCLGCPSILRMVPPQPGASPFEHRWLSQFLLENLDRLPFKKKLDKKVALHDSCITVSTPNGVEITRTLLRAIPGVTLVEMAHNRQDALCCGGATTATRPEIGNRLRRAPMEEAKAAGADILVTQCSGCHQAYAPLEHAFPFEVKSYVSVVAEALGVQHEDKFKKYANYRDLNKVLDESRECVSASDYSEDEIRRFLSDRWKCELGVCSGCRYANQPDRGCVQPGVNDARAIRA